MSHEIEEVALQVSAAEVHRRIIELGGAGRMEEALALIHPEVIDHRGGTSGDHHGLDAWKDKWEHMHDGFQDVSVTVEHNVASGDFSVNRYTLRGTHSASGRRYEVTGLDMIRVQNGKLAEHWALADLAAMGRQLSADDSVEGPAQTDTGRQIRH
ncbi:ester cyclase [Sphaerisporangium rhizosphaerae]|uniref:Ester cyclase n=1 Tax=Sphaerisporangium rhizosphaerae TaxID=2269375 RepID=A0ABW2NZD1_9ACTN